MNDKRKTTPGYVFFYILFSADAWRIVLGILISAVLTPQLLKTNPLEGPAVIVLYLMMAAIGWAIASFPANKIALFLRKFILKGKI